MGGGFFEGKNWGRPDIANASLRIIIDAALSPWRGLSTLRGKNQATTGLLQYRQRFAVRQSGMGNMHTEKPIRLRSLQTMILR
jgi:hypothetical protein